MENDGLYIDPVEWLKAQVEAYLTTPNDKMSSDDLCEDSSALDRFVQYIEAKYQPKGIFDR